jgi:hypothetical protein
MENYLPKFMEKYLPVTCCRQSPIIIVENIGNMDSTTSPVAFSLLAGLQISI